MVRRLSFAQASSLTTTKKDRNAFTAKGARCVVGGLLLKNSRATCVSKVVEAQT